MQRVSLLSHRAILRLTKCQSGILTCLLNHQLENTVEPAQTLQIHRCGHLPRMLAAAPRFWLLVPSLLRQ